MVKSTLEVVSAPAYEPVSLLQARRWVRLEETDTNSDVELTLLIKAMRRYAENRTFRAFVQRRLRLSLDGWCYDQRYGVKIDLPFPPFASLFSFKYLDTDGVQQDMAAADYEVFSAYEPAFIIPAYQVSWPSIRLRPNSIQVVWDAGYAPGSPQDEAGHQEVLPENLKLWIQARLATLFDNREQLIVNGQVAEIPYAFTDGLLDDLVVGTRIA
jgi:uncharacterized phiE125 gp8 family phage protein